LTFAAHEVAEVAGKRSLRRRIASSLSYISTLFTELVEKVNLQKNEKEHAIQGSGLLDPQEHLVTAIRVGGGWPLGNYPSMFSQFFLLVIETFSLPNQILGYAVP
jgi:hypothetical protein